VVAVDVSAQMIARARDRLQAENVTFQTGSGYDLAGLADASFDLVFSYIVFQHVPDRAAIQSYVREAHRVLKIGGAFKFQLNGDLSNAEAGPLDTWRGASFAMDEARAMLENAGFALLAAEGIGTQYFVLTARKGEERGSTGLRSYIFPGEMWAVRQLLEGWGDAVDQSWRPVSPHCQTLLAVPAGGVRRFFAGLYFWPCTPFPTCRLSIWMDDTEVGVAEIAVPGDHYLEFPAPSGLSGEISVRLEITGPEQAARPAVRCMGIYAPRP
jgi:SAM-dependent methyltransferase